MDKTDIDPRFGELAPTLPPVALAKCEPFVERMLWHGLFVSSKEFEYRKTKAGVDAVVLMTMMMLQMKMPCYRFGDDPWVQPLLLMKRRTMNTSVLVFPPSPVDLSPTWSGTKCQIEVY